MSDDSEKPETLKPDESGPLAPTEYQKLLMKQWYESGNAGPAPFTTDKAGSQLLWMNRKQRRAIASANRKARR